MSDKKPREFWITRLLFEPGWRVITEQECQFGAKPSPDVFIHVREVLKNEPDWKSMAEELAEALHQITQTPCTRTLAHGEEALAKLEEINSGEKK